MTEVPRNFKLDLKEVPITIDNEPHILRQLDGKRRDAYLTDLANRVRVVDGKVGGLKNADGMQGKLIADTLLRENADGQLIHVKLSVIQSWPGTVLDELHKMCMELSGLDDKGEDDGTEGND